MKPFLVLALLLSPIAILAHGGGQTVQATSGDYLLTLDAVSAQLTSGNAERINFEIERKDSEQSVVFTNVWVRIVDPEENFLFAGNIGAAPAGLVTGISYLFHREGTYGITLRFQNSDATIAEAELPVVVLDGEADKASVDLLDAALLAAFGVLVATLLWFLWYRNHTKKTP